MSSHNAVQGNGVYKLQALDRAFAVLDLLAASNTPLGLAEIADALGLHKSTAHRFLMEAMRRALVQPKGVGYFRQPQRRVAGGEKIQDREGAIQRLQFVNS